MSDKIVFRNQRGYRVIDESPEEFNARCKALLDKLPDDHPEKNRILTADIDGDIIAGQYVEYRLEEIVNSDDFPTAI
jgi:hypothetical protein